MVRSHNRSKKCTHFQISAPNFRFELHSQAIVTGGNTGIGFEASKALAQKGYNVVLACRDEARGTEAARRIRNAVAGANIEFQPLDLADLASVRDFSARYLDSGRPLDVLLNNAGVMAPPEMRTKDGFELQMGVNHLGHYALTLQLLPRVLEAPKARIVNVSSSAHLFGHINFDDLNARRSYSSWREYGQSKLANVLFTYELSRRLPPRSNCTVNALHPGVVATELQRYILDVNNINPLAMPFLSLMKMFILTPEQGAQTSIHLCSSPEVEGISARYFDACKPVSSSRESYDLAVAARLFEMSAELTGVGLSVDRPISRV